MEELNNFLKSNEETDFDKEIENYPKEKLIDIVENGADIELMEAAFLKLSFIDEDYALTKGILFMILTEKKCWIVF